jgi:hypothetical protein
MPESTIADYTQKNNDDVGVAAECMNEGGSDTLFTALVPDTCLHMPSCVDMVGVTTEGRQRHLRQLR